MAVAFDIRFEDLEEILALFDRAPEITREELVRMVWEAELFLEREVKERTPVGVGGAGGLRGSIAAQEPRVLADAVVGVVGTSAAHAVPVELGTTPHFPPVAALVDWVRMKLGVEPALAEGVAYRVARKIAAHGTKGAHMFEGAFEASQGQINAMFRRAVQRIGARLGGA